jgi:hypothetical protein
MLVVEKGMGGIVTATANIAADKTNPEVDV